MISNCNRDGGQEIDYLHFHLLGGCRIGRMVGLPKESKKLMKELHEHKESKRTDDTVITSAVLASVNQLQHRLGKTEQETKLIRDAINDIGQHLCEVGLPKESKKLMKEL